MHYLKVQTASKENKLAEYLLASVCSSPTLESLSEIAETVCLAPGQQCLCRTKCNKSAQQAQLHTEVGRNIIHGKF